MSKVFAICVLLLLASCKYTFTETSKIRDDLSTRFALGSDKSFVVMLSNRQFGEDECGFHGSVVKEGNEYVRTEWHRGAKDYGDRLHYVGCRIGSHPSKWVIIKTNVFAFWYIENGVLVGMDVIKALDRV